MAYMAESQQGMIGSVGNLIYYKRRDSDKICVRRKGLFSKNRFKKDPQFARTRENNQEFAIRSHAASWIRSILSYLSPVFDRNIIALLSKPLSLVQKLDTVNVRGSRIIELDKRGYLLSGLNLNNRNSFESLFTGMLNSEIDNDNNKLVLTIPAQLRGVNFFPLSFPFYQFRLVAGFIPNLLKGPMDIAGDIYPEKWHNAASSDWLGCRQKQSESFTLEIELPSRPADSTLLYAVAICFSNSPQSSDVVKYVGAGRLEAIL